MDIPPAAPRWALQPLSQRNQRATAVLKVVGRLSGFRHIGMTPQIRDTAMPGPRWTDAEKHRLRSAIERGRALDRIRVPNRTDLAVRAQLRRMGLVQSRRIVRPWQPAEIQLLRVLLKRGMSARQIAKHGLLLGRTTNSISQVMRRRRWGDPVRSKRQRKARLLRGRDLQRFHTFLERHARVTSMLVITQKFRVSRGTVKRHLAKLGITVTWRDSMSMPSSKARQRQMAQLRNAERWTRWRVHQRRRLFVLRQKLTDADMVLPRRRCDLCHELWFATEDFFKPRPKRRSGRIVALYLSRTCRVCLSERRRAKRVNVREQAIG